MMAQISHQAIPELSPYFQEEFGEFTESDSNIAEEEAKEKGWNLFFNEKALKDIKETAQDEEKQRYVQRFKSKQKTYAQPQIRRLSCISRNPNVNKVVTMEEPTMPTLVDEELSELDDINRDNYIEPSATFGLEPLLVPEDEEAKKASKVVKSNFLDPSFLKHPPKRRTAELQELESEGRPG
jgi:hypothetical protein